MNHAAITQHLGGTYTALTARSGYLRTPMTIPADGTSIGAYLIDEPGGRVRITDDAELLFTAMTHEVAPSRARARLVRMIAEQCGLGLADNGELHVTCDGAEAPYYVARFLEAADRIAYVSMGFRPKAVIGFEMKVADVLQRAFPDRLTRNVTAPGASGHSLKFPFMLDKDGAHPILIQPVASKAGKLDWGNIYQAVGKFTDLKNNADLPYRRVAVLEAVEDVAIEQAQTALADATNVLVFRDDRQLVSRLAA